MPTAAQLAFSQGNGQGSVAAHDQRELRYAFSQEPGHGTIPSSVVFVAKAAQRGLLASWLASLLTKHGVCTLGVLPLGIFQGVVTYNSILADRAHYDHERARESWELENYAAGEVAELVSMYTSSGMSQEDAQQIASRLAKYHDISVEHHVLLELGLLRPLGDSSPAYMGVLSALSYMGASLVAPACNWLVGLFVRAAHPACWKPQGVSPQESAAALQAAAACPVHRAVQSATSSSGHQTSGCRGWSCGLTAPVVTSCVCLGVSGGLVWWRWSHLFSKIRHRVLWRHVSMTGACMLLCLVASQALRARCPALMCSRKV